MSDSLARTAFTASSPEVAMAAAPPRPERRFDPLNTAAIFFFLMTVVLASVSVIDAGPQTVAGMLLLVGLACVACLGLFALRSGVQAPAAEELDDARVVAALAEGAAVAGADGRVFAANAAWREALGTSPRLPKAGASAASLFTALSAARRGEIAPAQLRAHGAEHAALVSPLGGRRFLVRLTEGAKPAALLPPAAAEVLTAFAAAGPPPARVLDAFAAASPFGAALLDGDDPFGARIVEANPALAEMCGDGGCAGAVFGDLLDPASRAHAAEQLAAGARKAIEVRLASDPKRIAHLYLSRQADRYVAYLVDVSEQKQIELQLAQSAKMQAIGQLAGGVAHDLNNLLSAVFLELDLLASRHPLGDPSYEGLSRIRQTSARAADLVGQLLAYSRQQTVQREVLDIGELINKSEVLLRRLLPEDIRLVTDYGRNLPLVRADRSQLETVVMNLAVNGRDAIRMSKGGGAVTIRLSREGEGEAVGLGHPQAKGEQAVIEVSDDGPGIPPEVMDKIFDPFFTTKPVGEGTGLGLATVYGVIKQADGWIHVESKPGQGATFRIFLPVHTPAANTAPVEVKAKPVARDLSGAGRILFVEDEDSVRTAATLLLRARGYEVLEAANGEEALEIAEAHAGEIDLMISDVVMPGLQGPELLKQARRYLGTAPVMFISGYAEQEFSDLLEGETGVSFLAKPIDIKTLAERVKQELQQAA